MPSRALASRTLTTLSALTGGIAALALTSSIQSARQRTATTTTVVPESAQRSLGLGSPERSGGGI